MLRRVSTFCLAASLTWMTTDANPPSGNNAMDVAEMMKMAGGGPPDASKDKPEFPKFDEVTKGMESKKGLFTLWSYPASAKGKDKEKLLCQIPSSFLGEKFMLSISFSGGGFFTGFPLEQHVVQWERFGKQLVLIEPETHHVIDEGKTVSDVVRRTYPERIRASLPMVTTSPSGDPVIDLGKMLKNNFADIAWMSRMPSRYGGGGSGGGGVNATLSKWSKKKTFKLNVEIGVELAIRRSSPPGSYDKKQVHFSFWKLPKTSYKPRVADDRLGYFLTANQDWGKPTGERDIFNRYIDRWHLEKRDSSLALCEPKQPIIFYIEKTVPVRFRRAVRDGILDWNKAFEKIGFLNAIEVRQQTNDNEWKDLDPEDMRYSFFRWIVTGAGFAMGPHRSNPFTGQIYDADIVFDDSMVRHYEGYVDRLLPSEGVELETADPALRSFLDKHPQWKRNASDAQSFAFGEKKDNTVRDAMRERMGERGHIGCDYAQGMNHQLAIAHAVLAGQPKEVTERLLYDVVKEVVAHEVGHTLGLRHNFNASTIYTLEEIKRRRETGEPLVGSVMDYNPLLFFKDDSLKGHFITPTVGPYDYWVIEYGYRPADGSYKPKKNGDEGDKKEENQSEDEKEEEEVASANESPLSTIPQDVLDKLPPKIVEMIESQGAEATKDESSKDAPSKDETPEKKPSGPTFTGPNAAELKMLHAIASRAAEPELAYSTDEDTTIFGADPRSNRFDVGRDPINWAKERMALIEQRMDSILEWGVKEGESWYHLRRTFGSLLREKAYVLNYVGRYVGGQYVNRSHRGDPGAAPPFEMVEPEVQRQALAFIEDNLFQDDFFKYSPELLNRLAMPRWYHSGAQASVMVDYPVHSVISSFQWRALFYRLFPDTLRRIHDGEMKTDAADKFTVSQYLLRLRDACWSDSLDMKKLQAGSWTDAAPFISSIRRSLQREYLSVLEPLVRTKPGTVLSPDLHAMVEYCLVQLQEQVTQSMVSKKLDFASRAHLASCTSRIKRMLAPDLKEYGD